MWGEAALRRRHQLLATSHHQPPPATTSHHPCTKHRRPTPSHVTQAVTDMNEHHVIVLLGKAKRKGAGLMNEAGAAMVRQITDVFRKFNNDDKGHRNKHWQVKQLSLIMNADAVRRTIFTRSQTSCQCSAKEDVLIFYRGHWPSRLSPKPRGTFGGSTADDVWLNVPVLDLTADVLQVPSEVKSTIWA